MHISNIPFVCDVLGVDDVDFPISALVLLCCIIGFIKLASELFDLPDTSILKFL